MASVTYTCTNCDKIATFETEGATMFLMDDNVPRPPTYVVNCPSCGTRNSVTVEQ